MTQQQLDDINFTYNPTDEFDDVTEETAEQLLAHDSAAALTSAVMKLTNVIEVLTEKIEQQTGEIMDNTIHIRRMNLEKEENKANHDMSSSPSIDSVVSVHDEETETPSDPLAISPMETSPQQPPREANNNKRKNISPNTPSTSGASPSTSRGLVKVEKRPRVETKSDSVSPPENRVLKAENLTVESLNFNRLFLGWRNTDKFSGMRVIRGWMRSTLLDFYSKDRTDPQRERRRRIMIHCGPFPARLRTLCIFVNCNTPRCGRDHYCPECAYHLNIVSRDHSSFNQYCPLHMDMILALADN